MTALSLTKFLLARIAEDEAWVAADLYGGDRYRPYGRLEPDNPVRVKAECDAKRRIVQAGPSECDGYADQDEYGAHHYPDPEWSHCDGCSAAQSASNDWERTLQVIAAVYADHPDYRGEWRA